MQRLCWTAALVGSAALAAPGCAPFTFATSPCADEAFATSLNLDFGEALQRPGDWVSRGSTDAGVRVYASGRGVGGRFFATLYEPLADGPIPGSTATPAGCTLPTRLQFRDDADGKLKPAQANLTLHGSASPADPTLDLELTGLVQVLADGGTAPGLPDQRYALEWLSSN